jgi:hypothetical protein
MNTSDVIRAIRQADSSETAAAAIVELSSDASPEELLRVLGLTLSLGAISPAKLDEIVEHLGTPPLVTDDSDVVAARAAVNQLEQQLLGLGSSSDVIEQVGVVRDAIAAIETSLRTNEAELTALTARHATAEALLKELE